MIKYNDNNIYVGEIKQLLKNFNLPNISSHADKVGVANNMHFIKDGCIYFHSDDKDVFVDNYVFGQKYSNITSNLRITSNIYESYTHKYLGNYLRLLKDVKGIDLMSMYNCFSNEQLRNITIAVNRTINEFTETIESFSSKDTSHNIYCVSVRFGEVYTIAINCATKVSMTACLYRDGRLIDSKSSMLYDTYDVMRNCSLNHPYVYDKLSNYSPTDMELRDEDCLCLVIKVPVSCDSSIVVLEGDYVDCTKIDYANNQRLVGKLLKYKATIRTDDEGYYIDKDSSYFGKFDYLSKPELLSYMNSKGSNLLATRLMEYLCGNVITPESESYDIDKLQRQLIKKGLVKSDYLGTWSEYDKEALYEFINDIELNSNKYDVISYLDKDVEYRLGGIV